MLRVFENKNNLVRYTRSMSEVCNILHIKSLQLSDTCGAFYSCFLSCRYYLMTLRFGCQGKLTKPLSPCG